MLPTVEIISMNVRDFEKATYCNATMIPSDSRCDDLSRISGHSPQPKGVRMLSIRRAAVSDVDSITKIYNEAILTTTATFDLEPKTRAD